VRKQEERSRKQGRAAAVLNQRPPNRPRIPARMEQQLRK